MTDLWQSNQTAVAIQEGGPGNAILLLRADATVTGPSGGGQSVVSRFTRDYKRGAGAYTRAGVVKDSDPEPFTFDVMQRLNHTDFVRVLKKLECEHNLFVREHCGAVEDMTNFNSMLVMAETFGIGGSLSDNIAQGMTAQAVEVNRVVNESASEQVPVIKVQHLDISGTVSDIALNDIISVGIQQCAGDCGPTNDGNQDFWAVGDSDATPGYGGAGAPNFLYTTDGGTTWGTKAIDVFLSGNALRVIRVGAYVLTCSATNGVAYARFQDILDGVANPWALATGLTTPFPNALTYAGDNTVWAVGNTGRIWKSTDGGFTFTLVSNAAQTSQNLNDVVFATPNLGWIVGNAGVIIKYYNGALSLLNAVSGLTANLLTIATPDRRTNELYIGTAVGTIWRTRDQGKTFAALTVPLNGSGQINKVAFSGYKGLIFWALQKNAAGTKSRILRDYSGGYMQSNAVDVVGTFDTPDNSIINSIAPSDANVALTVGELNGSVSAAFIGKVS